MVTSPPRTAGPPTQWSFPVAAGNAAITAAIQRRAHRKATGAAPSGPSPAKPAATAARTDERKLLEARTLAQFGGFRQRIHTVFDSEQERVGKSESLREAASTALGAVGSVIAGRTGNELGEGAGVIVADIATRIAGFLGAKFPEVKGDANAAGYLHRVETILAKEISHTIDTLQSKHLSVNELRKLHNWLQSEATSTEHLKKVVGDQLTEYQQSVEEMYERPREIGTSPGYRQTLQRPALGRVPDPKRGHKLHLAIVQALYLYEPGIEEPRKQYSFHRFIAPGLGPEARATMKATHKGEPICVYALRDKDSIYAGLRKLSC